MTKERVPMTIRALADYWSMTVEQLADLPIMFRVEDGQRHFEYYSPHMGYPSANLHRPDPTTGSPGQICFVPIISETRMVKTARTIAKEKAKEQ